MLDAVIFDFDGVIADTEPLHYRAFQSVLEPLGKGFGWDSYCSDYLGFDDRDAFRKALGGDTMGPHGLDELILLKAEAFQRRVAREAVSPYPGVIELITQLHGQVLLGLCSGGLNSDILPIIRQLGIEECFQAIVTAEDTPSSKPDPAPYRLILRRLGLDAGACAAAIEDSNAGIASASRAGLLVLAVTNSHERDQLRGYDAVTDSLENIGHSLLGRNLFDRPC